jgi:hypothetical protein
VDGVLTGATTDGDGQFGNSNAKKKGVTRNKTRRFFNMMNE